MFKRIYGTVNAFLLEIIGVIAVCEFSEMIYNHYDFAHNCAKDGKFVIAVIGTIISGVFCFGLSIRMLDRIIADKMIYYFKDIKCQDCVNLQNKLADATRENSKLKDNIVILHARVD